MAHKTALITGASSGIGKATALAFAKAGINLLLVGRSQERLQPVLAAATAAGVQATAHEIDLAQLALVRPQNHPNYPGLWFCRYLGKQCRHSIHQSTARYASSRMAADH